MNIIEKKIISRLFLDDRQDVFNEIYRIPSRYLSKKTNEIVKNHRETILTGRSVDALVEKYKEIVELVISEYVSTIDSIDNYIKDLRIDFVKSELEKSSKLDNPEIILNTISSLKDELLGESIHNIKKINVGDVGSEYFEIIDTATPPLVTGFDKLDKRVDFTRENLNIICARPSVGKSAFALTLSLNLAKNNHKGIMFNLEMSNKEVIDRMMSQKSKVDLKRINSPKKFKSLVDDDLKRLVYAAGEYQKLGNNLELISSNFSLDKIKEHSIFKKEHGGLDFIVIDYLQLIDEKNGFNRYEKVTEISLGLKRIAKELDIVVIALAQLNRENEKRVNKRPMLSDLKESGQIEQDASVVIGLHSEPVIDSVVSKFDLEAIVLKNRTGPKGTLHFDFYPDTQSILEK